MEIILIRMRRVFFKQSMMKKDLKKGDKEKLRKSLNDFSKRQRFLIMMTYQMIQKKNKNKLKMK